MELFLRDNDLSNWIELESGVSLKIAYPTYEQETEISGKFVDCMNVKDEGFKPFVEYYALIVRYCVKDWKGIDNPKTNEPVKCEIDGNQLNKNIMAALVRDPNLISYWGFEIKKQLDFDDTDKKK